MLSILHVFYSTIAGICLYAGIIHLFIALRNPSKKVHLIFALMSLSFTLAAFFKNWMYNAASLDAGLQAVKWVFNFEFLYGIFFIWFIVFYTRMNKKNPFAMLLSASILFIIVLNTFSPNTY